MPRICNVVILLTWLDPWDKPKDDVERVVALVPIINQNARTSRALHYLGVTSNYFSAASVISVVKAPEGSLVMTGSEPPPSSVLTVRS
ncbi:hypothetical protein C9418_12255 [Rhizobium sp. SEMIA 4032]|nr:hypothetical protein C9418_12255 [Rhizobium sp. SEMIA 4032]TKV76095.1 hypothetical protein D0C28_10500 [Rhizobium sp. AU243]